MIVQNLYRIDFGHFPFKFLFNSVHLLILNDFLSESDLATMVINRCKFHFPYLVSWAWQWFQKLAWLLALQSIISKKYLTFLYRILALSVLNTSWCFLFIFFGNGDNFLLCEWLFVWTWRYLKVNKVLVYVKWRRRYLFFRLRCDCACISINFNIFWCWIIANLLDIWLICHLSLNFFLRVFSDIESSIATSQGE